MLRRRADDLKKHTASVQIFLAALADRENTPDVGLAYIDKALEQDQSDLDALKYKALLLLNKGELNNAEHAFDRLRVRATRNARYRADAHLGLGTVKFKRGIDQFGDALQSLATAFNNITSVSSAEQDHVTFAQIYTLQGDMLGTPGWPGTDKAKSLECYRKAKEALGLVPNKRKSLETKVAEIQAKIEQEEGATGSQLVS
jgi:tetratricopeptide (TPR) repeat protein